MKLGGEQTYTKGAPIRFTGEGPLGAMIDEDSTKFVGTVDPEKVIGRYLGPHPNPALREWHLVAVKVTDVVLDENALDAAELILEGLEEFVVAAYFRTIDEARPGELCSHEGEPTSTRVAHGYLGDAPVGTVQTLCDACGFVLEEVRP